MLTLFNNMTVSDSLRSFSTFLSSCIIRLCAKFLIANQKINEILSKRRALIIDDLIRFFAEHFLKIRNQIIFLNIKLFLTRA